MHAVSLAQCWIVLSGLGRATTLAVAMVPAVRAIRNRKARRLGCVARNEQRGSIDTPSYDGCGVHRRMRVYGKIRAELPYETLWLCVRTSQGQIFPQARVAPFGPDGIWSGDVCLGAEARDGDREFVIMLLALTRYEVPAFANPPLGGFEWDGRRPLAERMVARIPD